MTRKILIIGIIVLAVILTSLFFTGSEPSSTGNEPSNNNEPSSTEPLSSNGGGSEVFLTDNNFILIDKIPSGYSVRFELSDTLDTARFAGLTSVSSQDFDLRCLGMGGTGREFLIDSQATYQRLMDESPDLHPNPFLGCIDYEFPEINFSRKAVLGLSVGMSGCNIQIQKQLFRDTTARQYIYYVAAESQGACE